MYSKPLKTAGVDMGVVDRLYGARHQGEYGVGKTSVVLTPVELRFAVPKGKNKGLLEAIDYHLKKLKDDPQSIYYQMLDEIFGVSLTTSVSKWLLWGTVIAGLTAMLAGGMSLFLKRQVRTKTSQLSIQNEALNTEIRKRREAREALIQSEARYRSLVENTLDGYFVFEYPSGEIRFLNQRICELLGYTSEEAYQKRLWDFMTRKDQARLKARFGRQAEVSSYERVPFACTAVRKDGTTFSAETSTSVVNEQGETLIQGSLRDITEQQRLERHLQHAEKMEAIGTLAGGIAHDFNNLLMGILGNASLARMDLDPQHPQQEKLKYIEEYVKSGSQLTKQLLGFARGGKYEVKELALNDVVEKTSRMFGRTKKEIRIHTSYEMKAGTVEADQGQIEQVLLNMYVNAWQAMPRGGELYLETQTVTVDENHVRAGLGKTGRYFKISITDTGVGMDKRTKERIFEPFFTTREMGRGTGLGLASSYGIIKNHGGFIDVYSEPGKGTTFSIYLPMTQADTTPDDAKEEKTVEIQKGEGTVLLVDDEDMIVEVGEHLLNRIGYRALVAKSGEEAVSIYRDSNASIDLVILDMIMPGMGGRQTFECLKQIDPSIKVILSSGYSMNTETKEILNHGCRGFIQKPFSMAQLSQKLNEVARAA
jgi:two-component system cell cycle sensor histidine kinase/response regulator CckA